MTVRSLKRPFRGYRTTRGHYWNTSIEDWLESSTASRLRKKVNLIMTSPPFPLSRKKAYGNLTGRKYVRWLANLAPKLGDLLTDDGSLVIEIGNGDRDRLGIVTAIGVIGRNDQFVDVVQVGIRRRLEIGCRGKGQFAGGRVDREGPLIRRNDQRQ